MSTHSLIVPQHVAAAHTAQRTAARIKTMRGEFERAQWNGVNESGRVPVGDRVLVLPDPAARQSEGSVHLPDEFVERANLAGESGVLVALGDDAFTWNADRTRRFAGERPQIGDRVYFARYQYSEVTGHDGRKYWVLADHSIIARDERPAA